MKAALAVSKIKSRHFQSQTLIELAAYLASFRCRIEAVYVHFVEVQPLLRNRDWSYSSRIATARHQPAPAFEIFTGKHATLKP